MRTLALVVALVVSAPAIATADSDQAALVKNRIELAGKVYAAMVAKYKAGTVALEQVAAWSVRWLTAVREQPVKGAKLKAALAEHVARMKDLESAAVAAAKAGTAPTSDAEAAAYFVAEAELWAARAK